jgi:hypothetical protein
LLYRIAEQDHEPDGAGLVHRYVILEIVLRCEWSL